MAFFKFKKGSPEAKAHMARIRGLRGKKKRSKVSANPRKRKVPSKYRTPGRLKRSQQRFIANWKTNPRKRKNPVRKLSESKHAKKLRALREQLHRRGIFVNARQLYDMRALRKLRNNPGKRPTLHLQKMRRTQRAVQSWNRAPIHPVGLGKGREVIYKKKRRKIARNPIAKRRGEGNFSIAGNIDGKLGFFTGNSFDSVEHKAMLYPTQARALESARKLANNYGMLMTVYSGDTRTEKIRKVLGL